MSGPGDSPYSGSSSETADSDRGVMQARSVGTELAEAPPAEPMSREEYAIFMRQGPAAGPGDHDAGDENGTEYAGESGHGGDSWNDPADLAQGMTRQEYADHMRDGSAAGTDDHDPGEGNGADATGDVGYQPGVEDPAGHAQGMSRSEYADYMRQGPTAGEDDSGFGDYSDPAPEQRAAYPERGTETSQLRDADQAATFLDPAGQTAESLTCQEAMAENDGNAPDPDSFLAGASAETNSVAGAGGGERAHEALQADRVGRDPPVGSGTEEGVPSRDATQAQETPGHEAPPGS